MRGGAGVADGLGARERAGAAGCFAAFALRLPARADSATHTAIIAATITVIANAFFIAPTTFRN
jgi:hypothetical protein